jgi:branched-chain amino acid transport system permease protein
MASNDDFKKLKRDGSVSLGLLALASIVPLLGPAPYLLGQITLFFIWASVVVQWNLVFGVAGIMTLGQVATFAIGAYATGMVALYLHPPFWVAMLSAVPFAVLFNLLLGLLTMRMRGEYVAIVTLAVALLFSALVVNDVSCFKRVDMICYNFTGGTRGLIGYGDLGWAKILGFKFRAFGDYYLALAVLFVGFILALAVIHGPYGLAFGAIRDNEVYARSRGVDYRKYQLFVFALSGVVTGLSGAVYANYLKTVGPTLLDMSLLIFLLSMMVVGGRGTIWGPLLGSAALMLTDNVFQTFGAWRTGGLAAVTLLFVIFFPGGLASGLRAVKTFVSASRQRAGAEKIGKEQHEH